MHSIELSETEWQLLVELLEREQNTLRVEIRHTDTTEFRERLRKRLKTGEELLVRMQGAAAA